MSPTATVSAAPHGSGPLRELRATVDALRELGAVLGPLRPLVSAVLAGQPAQHIPAAAGKASGAARRPGAAAPRPIGDAVTSEGATHHWRRPLVATLSRPANAAFLVILTVLLTAWWVELRPTSFFGGPASFVVVRGTSMLPTLRTGDFVLAEARPAYHVGDLVIYSVPRGQVGAGDTLIHRIVSGSTTSGFIIQGDNNPAPDPWTVPSSDVLGRETVVVRGAGNWLLVVRTPLFAGLVAALIAVTLVIRPPEWMRRRQEQPSPAGTPEPIAAPAAPAPPADTAATQARAPRRTGRRAP